MRGMRFQLVLLVWLQVGLQMSAAEGSFDQVVVKDVFDGVEVHEINVRTLDHDEVGITIDGIVDEPVWQAIPAFDQMIVTTPDLRQPSDFPTATRFIATEQGLYVSSVMDQPKDLLQMRMSRRDWLSEGDRWGFTLDPGGQGTFAYWFGVALGDSIQDGKVLPERRFSSDWDGPWYYKSAVTKSGWSVETFYPWSIFSLPEQEGPRQIGFAVNRSVAFKDQRFYWPGHPYSSSQFVTVLNTMSIEGVKPRPLLAAIPYVSSTADSARDDHELRAGVDITWKPLSEAAVTASIYPDFGAVEADDVVLNLSARETFFPEKRLFFLEGNEVFETTPRSSAGNILRELTNEDFAVTSRRSFMYDYMTPPISLLNTRRIGGAARQVRIPDGLTPARGESGIPTELFGALKLTGQARSLSYGVFGVAEDEVEWRAFDASGQKAKIREDGRNFGIVRLNYERSAGDRFAFGYLGTLVDGPVYQARVHGVDAHFAKQNGLWSSDLQLIRSKVANVSGTGAMLNFDYAVSSRFQHHLRLDYFDEDVDINDLGFLQRNDFRGLQYIFRYALPNSDGFVRRTRGAISMERRENISAGQLVDGGIYWRNTMELTGRNTLRTGLAWFPERFEDLDSRGNGSYKAEDRVWWQTMLNTDSSKMFSWTFLVGGVQEDLGDWTQIYRVGVTARPMSRIIFNADINYRRRDGWLVYQGARNFGAYNGIEWQPSIQLDWFIKPRHQLRFSLQWVGVRADGQEFYAVPAQGGELLPVVRERTDFDFTVSILTTQLRYRWEIAPLTDLYVVYNRGNRLPYRAKDSFLGLFQDAFDDPLVNSFIIKLRYRFGN